MKNEFLLEELILESRLDDVKKKYSDISPKIIERLSSLDPSGNNKYLDWMVKTYSDVDISVNELSEIINLFHKNINKLTKEFFDEFIKKKRYGWLLDDNSPAAKNFQKIYNSPKDINVYGGFFLDMTKQILLAVDSKLTKSDIKKLDANVLYNSDDLLIMIPKSHKASCYYGAGTKWCTTNKDSDSHFNNYTKRGVLIYVINKKEPETNPWYKVAFHISFSSGYAESYNAPDEPRSIKIAMEHLGDKWVIVRDTIVEYLHANKVKGIENFYFGPELLYWLESLDINPFEFMPVKQLVDKVGFTELYKYIRKKDIDVFKVFDLSTLFNFYGLMIKNPYEVIRKIWDEYKNRGENPLPYLLYNKEVNRMLLKSVNNTISLDEFLEASMSIEKNIFFVINNTFINDNKTFEMLLELFNNDVDLIFDYAKTIDVNLLDVLNPTVIDLLLSKKFDLEDAFKYLLKNKEHLNGSLNDYGFSNYLVINYLKKLKVDSSIVKEIIDKKLIKNLSLKDVIFLYDDIDTSFKTWLELNHESPINSDFFNNKFIYREILDKVGSDIKEVFPTVYSFEKTLKNDFDVDLDLLKTHLPLKTIYKSFFEDDFYSFYKLYYERDLVDKLNVVILIKAYEDAPIDDDTNLKETVLNTVYEQLRGNTINKLERNNNTNYVVYNDLKKVLELFTENKILYDVLSGNYTSSDIYLDFKNISEVIFHNEKIINIIKEYLMVNFRDIKISLNLDWFEDFNYLDLKVNEDKGILSFTLYDEVIYDLSDINLQTLVEFSPELIEVKNIIEKRVKTLSTEKVKMESKNKLISMMEDIFGNGYMGIKNNEDKNLYYFKYDYLMDDVMGFANNYVFHEDELPDSVHDLISNLMENDFGRFYGLVDSEELELFIEDLTDFRATNNEIINSIIDNLVVDLNDVFTKMSTE